jgi:hypothetical protein
LGSEPAENTANSYGNRYQCEGSCPSKTLSTFPSSLLETAAPSLRRTDEAWPAQLYIRQGTESLTDKAATQPPKPASSLGALEIPFPPGRAKQIFLFFIAVVLICQFIANALPIHFEPYGSTSGPDCDLHNNFQDPWKSSFPVH